MARGQNLLSKVFNKPLLITASDLQPIADYLSNPERVASLKFETSIEQLPQLANYENESLYKQAVLEHYDINPQTMTGVLNIDGVLVNREGQMNSQCVELTSYQGLKRRFEAQVAQGMKSCVLMISSGGGDAFGAWSTANYVKKVARENNVKLTTFINGSACSAAYVWAVVADEIVSHPMGQAGSIGVLVQLYNDSKYLENLGVARSFVYAGGNKIPFDKNGDFTDKFISDLQKSVDSTYKKFVNHVVAHRNLTEQQVIDTNASVFDAEDAIKLGLIDKIMELEDFEIEYGLKTKTQATGNGAFLQTNKPVETMNNHLNKETLTMTEQVIETPVEQALEATVEVVEKALDVATEGQEQVLTVEGLQAQLSDLQANFDTEKQTLTAQLADVQTKLASANDQLAQAQKALSDYKEEVQQKARLAQLENVFGKDSEKPKEYASIFASLDDVAFGKVLQGFSTSVEQLEASLEEVGSSAPVEAVSQTAEDITLEVARKKKAARTQ